MMTDLTHREPIFNSQKDCEALCATVTNDCAFPGWKRKIARGCRLCNFLLVSLILLDFDVCSVESQR